MPNQEKSINYNFLFLFDNNYVLKIKFDIYQEGSIKK